MGWPIIKSLAVISIFAIYNYNQLTHNNRATLEGHYALVQIIFLTKQQIINFFLHNFAYILINFSSIWIMYNKYLLFSAMLSSIVVTPLAAQDVVTYVMMHNTSDNTVVNRIDYTYDTQNRVVEELTRVPNSEGGFDNQYRENYGYDDQGRQNVVEKLLWDETQWFWYPNSTIDDKRTKTVFNDDNRPAEVFYYSEYDSQSGEWSDSYEYHGVFEYNGNTATETRTKYINGIQVANGGSIIDYTFDDNLNIEEKISSLYMDVDWDYEIEKIPQDRYVYEYDDHSNVTLEEHYTNSTDTEDPTWALMYSYKYTYEYDDSGKITRKAQSNYVEINDAYEPYSDFTYEYFYGTNDALELDYANNFDTTNALEDFTTEDGNKDGNTWTLTGGSLQVTSAQASEAPEILYLPAIRFSTDNEVEITFNARLAEGDTANVQMILCSNDNAHTPLGTIGEIHKVVSTEYTQVLGRVVAEKNSPYVIGICFDNNCTGTTLVIDDLAVKNGRSTDTPMAPYYLRATAERTGLLQVSLTYAPYTFTIGGEYIESVDKTELYRDGVEDPIFSTGEVSTSLEQRFIDETIPERGEYTYRVYCYKDGLRSDATTVSVKVGYPVPHPITGFKAVENEDHTVTLSWDAPAAEDGDVKYWIIRNNEVEVARDFTGTSFTDRTIDTSAGQTYVFYRVQPYNEIGAGNNCYSESLFVGEPSAIPFRESWPGKTGTHLWLEDMINGIDQAWGYASSYNDIDPQDGDGGMAMFLSTQIEPGYATRLTSEKIDLSSTTAPEVAFYMYIYPGEVSNDALVVEASTDNGEFQIVSAPISASMPETSGWRQHIVPLEGFAGEKNVRIAFRGISDATYDIAIDNVVVGEHGCAGISQATVTNARVYAAAGTITVESDAVSDIRIYSISGTPIYSANAQSARVQAAPGAYIVTVDGKATKVLVN